MNKKAKRPAEALSATTVVSSAGGKKNEFGASLGNPFNSDFRGIHASPRNKRLKKDDGYHAAIVLEAARKIIARLASSSAPRTAALTGKNIRGTNATAAFSRKSPVGKRIWDEVRVCMWAREVI